MYPCFASAKLPEGYPANYPIAQFAYPQDRSLMGVILDNYRQVSRHMLSVPQFCPQQGPARPPNFFIKQDDNIIVANNFPPVSMPMQQRFPPSCPVANGPLRIPENSLQSSVVLMTEIEKENVAAFVVGGEKRLCWTNLLDTVLKNFNKQQVENKKSSLRIYTSCCSDKQLETLKKIGVLPWTQSHCLLISKSDAARLCSALLRPPVKINNTNNSSKERRQYQGFDISHECFGGCSGTFVVEKYTDDNALCILCSQCGTFYSPSQFVTHNHKGYESKLCHWGFDSSQWRSYISLVDENATKEHNDEWEVIKRKFVDGAICYKRVAADTTKCPQTKKVRVDRTSDADKYNGSENDDCNNKRSKEKEEVFNKPSVSAFRPWCTGEVVARVPEKSEVSSVDNMSPNVTTGKELPLVASAGLTDDDTSDQSNLMGFAKICLEVEKNKESDSDDKDVLVDVDSSDNEMSTKRNKQCELERKIKLLEQSLEKVKEEKDAIHKKNFLLQKELNVIHEGRKASN